MKLREYQEELINNARNSFIDSNRTLCVAPCGAGKTVMFAYMCSSHIKLHPSGYVWFLVHREELIDQTIKTFDDNNLDRNNVLIGMVQTITRHMENYRAPTMIIFDEAHHAISKTWLNIINKFPDVPLIGLTATPCRLDGKPLGNIFQKMIIGRDANWLINHDYLSPYKYYAPRIELEESKWEIKGSDYNQQIIADQLDKPKIYGDIMKYIGLENKTIIYAPTIKLSQKIESEINSYFGKTVCRHFDGNTNKSERREIIEKFRNGDIRILTNVDLIGEGFDVPDCNSIMLLRPTLSTALYIQQSMRCMRHKPGKTAIIYDLVGNVFKHGLPDDEREWSLNKPLKIRNKTECKDLLVRECKTCLMVYKGSGRICPYCGSDNGKTMAEIELDKKKELEEIKELQKKKERREVWMARDFDALVKIGIQRGYKNPAFWANQILKSRNSKNI